MPNVVFQDPSIAKKLETPTCKVGGRSRGQCAGGYSRNRTPHHSSIMVQPRVRKLPCTDKNAFVGGFGRRFLQRFGWLARLARGFYFVRSTIVCCPNEGVCMHCVSTPAAFANVTQNPINIVGFSGGAPNTHISAHHRQEKVFMDTRDGCVCNAQCKKILGGSRVALCAQIPLHTMG